MGLSQQHGQCLPEAFSPRAVQVCSVASGLCNTWSMLSQVAEFLLEKGLLQKEDKLCCFWPCGWSHFITKALGSHREGQPGRDIESTLGIGLTGREFKIILLETG